MRWRRTESIRGLYRPLSFAGFRSRTRGMPTPRPHKPHSEITSPTARRLQSRMTSSAAQNAVAASLYEAFESLLGRFPVDKTRTAS